MTQNDMIRLCLQRCNGNPMAMNVLKMMQDGNSKGLEEMARNLCKEKGVTPQQVMDSVKSMFNMN